MDQHLSDIRPETPPPSSSAAAAFDQLRGEVGLMRRAIEQLITEQREAPDYTPQFEQHGRDIEALMRWCGAISKQPGMTLTPERYAEDIERASVTARSADHAALQGAKIGMERAVAKVHEASEARRIARISGGGAFLSGMLVALGLVSWG